MNGKNEENLNELFEKFLDSGQAEGCAEDIEKGEQILREHPAPEPDDMLIANIKAEIAMHLPSRRRYLFEHIAYKAACAAATIMILTAIGLKLFDKDSGTHGRVQYATIIPAAIWESDNLAADDTDLAIYTTEIEQIEEKLLTLQSGDYSGNGESRVTELEMELIEIDSSDFWKG
jgi:hypothetical protein